MSGVEVDVKTGLQYRTIDGKRFRRYKWSPQTLDFTNNTEHFLVVVGASTDSIDADAELLRVDNAAGTGIDGVLVKGFGVAANEQVIQLTRRMLVPPGYVVNGTTGALISVVECATLEDALAIL